MKISCGPLQVIISWALIVLFMKRQRGARMRALDGRRRSL